jgi:hypothetical protein
VVQQLLAFGPAKFAFAIVFLLQSASLGDEGIDLGVISWGVELRGRRIEPRVEVEVGLREYVDDTPLRSGGGGWVLRIARRVRVGKCEYGDDTRRRRSRRRVRRWSERWS